MTTHGPLLYGPLASWLPILSAPADYAEEAAFYRRTLEEAGVELEHSEVEEGLEMFLGRAGQT